MISRVSPHEQEPIENDTMIFSHRLFIGLTLGLLWTMVGVAAPLDAEQAERAIIAACRADNGRKTCATACLQHGFKDTFSDLQSYSNATNKLCQYELATKQAKKMRFKNAANVKVLPGDASIDTIGRVHGQQQNMVRVMPRPFLSGLRNAPHRSDSVSGMRGNRRVQEQQDTTLIIFHQSPLQRARFPFPEIVAAGPTFGQRRGPATGRADFHAGTGLLAKE
jgi:hypothetical protein